MLMMFLCLSFETEKKSFLLALSARAKGDWNLHNKAWVQTTFECYLMLCERGRRFLIRPPELKSKARKGKKNKSFCLSRKGSISIHIFMDT